jgi:hypothetical protein
MLIVTAYVGYIEEDERVILRKKSSAMAQMRRW